MLTYRRATSLKAGLHALCGEVRAYGPGQVLVVDNDPDAGARTVVESFTSRGVQYVHEPRPGIAAARNRGLDEASGLLVFIDDDERPEPGWLMALVGTWLDTGAAGVAGFVRSEFSASLDPWIAAGRFFQRRQLPTGTDIDVAATNNLLLDLEQVHRLGLRFDDRFGLVGGSDHMFTASLTRAGARLVWCAEAVVVDQVPRDRQTRSWVLRRAFRMGNGTSLVRVALAEREGRVGAVRAGQCGQGLVRLAVGVPRVVLGTVGRSEDWQANGARNCARGAGLVFGAFGVVYAEYGRAGRKRSSLRRRLQEGGTVRVDRP